jgi:signal transduction histidine kinase
VSLGQSRLVGLQVLNRAFSRLAHVVGYVCITGALVDVIGYQSADHTDVIWPMIFPLIATGVILGALDRWRTTAWSICFLLVGGASVYVLAVTLLLQVEGLRSDALAISLVRVALILVGGSGFTWRKGVSWTIAGFLVGEIAAYFAAAQVGAPLSLDEGAIETFIVILVLLATLTITRRAQARMRPELDRAAIDEEVSELRHRIEGRAAALLHDTVLDHLDAIRVTRGTMHADLQEQLTRDLELLRGDHWLVDPESGREQEARSGWRRSAILAAITEVREKSLTVEVTGDLTAVARLTPDRDIAVGLAVKQCLVNVLRHAQVEYADVVIIGSADGVSVMVIDAGRGFSEQRVGADRLGIRQSIRRRIEGVGGEVQLWSTPGRGTSIMIRVPALADAFGPEAAARE